MLELMPTGDENPKEIARGVLAHIEANDPKALAEIRRRGSELVSKKRLRIVAERDRGEGVLVFWGFGLNFKSIGNKESIYGSVSIDPKYQVIFISGNCALIESDAEKDIKGADSLAGDLEKTLLACLRNMGYRDKRKEYRNFREEELNRPAGRNKVGFSKAAEKARKRLVKSAIQ